MNTSRIAAGTAVLVLVLTACSGPQPQTTSTASVATASAPTATPGPIPTATSKENERGQLIQKIGEAVTLYTNGYDAPPTLTFKVTSIKPIKCDAPSATPPKGTAIAVALEIATSPTFSGPPQENGQAGRISFHPSYWRGYAPNGTPMNTVKSPVQRDCLADTTTLLPDSFGKGEKLTGLVILDVTTPTGEVAFDPYGGGGWVWKYPATSTQ